MPHTGRPRATSGPTVLRQELLLSGWSAKEVAAGYVLCKHTRFCGCGFGQDWLPACSSSAVRKLRQRLPIAVPCQICSMLAVVGSRDGMRLPCPNCETPCAVCA